MSQGEGENIEHQPKPDITPEAIGVRKALVGVNERLRNILSPPFGYQKLRESGLYTDTTAEDDLKDLLSNLQRLSNNIVGAVDVIDRGGKLPEIDEGTHAMIDLKYTNYNNSGNSTSERK